MFQGIANSIRRTYDSAQRKFLEFCRWSKCLNDNGSPLPASDVNRHSPVAYGKSVVYQGLFNWSAIAPYRNGLAIPPSNCLRLERVLRGVKRSQGISTRQRLPVTLAIQSRIRAVLNFDCYDDILFWAACCTGFFGFLRSGEFTTPSSKFDSRILLALSDVKIDTHTTQR